MPARAAEDLAERLEAIPGARGPTLVLGGGALHRVLDARPALRERLAPVFTADPCAALGDIACDPERLPIAEAAFGVAVSPLLLHWCNDLPGALVQLRRALKPDGVFLGAAFGAETLRELRTVLLEAELEETGGASARIAPFGVVQDYAHLLQRAGFALPATDRELVTVRYRDPTRLFSDSRAMGETSALRERGKPLTRNILARALDLYAQRYAEADGRVRATFELIVMTGWAPAPTQPKPLRPGAAQSRLADALKTTERSAGEKAGQ